MLHYAGTGWVDLLITLIIICAVAWLLLWAVQRFLPEVYQPARIVVGVGEAHIVTPCFAAHSMNSGVGPTA